MIDFKVPATWIGNTIIVALKIPIGQKDNITFPMFKAKLLADLPGALHLETLPGAIETLFPKDNVQQMTLDSAIERPQMRLHLP